MTNERRTRPELERSEPVRDWSTMFRASGSNGHGNGHGSTGDASEPDAQEADRDVGMGYRVVEEYMRRGAAAAREMSEGISSGPDSRAANQLFERLLQSATDLGGVWIEMLQTLWSSQASDVPRGAGPGSFELQSAPAQPGAPAAAPAADAVIASAKQSPAIAFRVQGGRSVELSATLSAEPRVGQQWIVHDLRALDPSVPRIERAHFEYHCEQARCVIAVDIPAAQPAGVYSGLIVDAESNLPRGTVSVRLLA